MIFVWFLATCALAFSSVQMYEAELKRIENIPPSNVL